jgi:DNA-directed RNA polymerase specialized sigma24 family protein
MLLLLREMEGYSVAELGTLFDAEEEMIRARLLRARQKLIGRSPKNALASHQL